MEAEYGKRKLELLEACQVAPQVFERILPRLEMSMEPFVESLVRREQREHDGVIVFDPSGFAKSGKKSVGVQRQWCR